MFYEFKKDNCDLCFIVVSDLVKKEHSFKNFPLTVIPYYEGFNKLQEIVNRTTGFSADYHLEPFIMDYIINQEDIKGRFDLKTIEYDKGNSTINITKEFDDLMMTQELKNKLNDFFSVFVKDDVKIPKVFFKNVKETVEKDERLESNASKIYFDFDGSRVILVGRKQEVELKKQSIEAMVDTISEDNKFVATEFLINDEIKLKFLTFIDYIKNLMREFPGVQIHEMDKSSGKFSLLGTAEKTRKVQSKVDMDLSKISKIEVEMSDYQIEFLKRTNSQIVNDELRKYDEMLMLVPKKEVVGTGGLRAEITTLKTCAVDEVHILTSDKLNEYLIKLR